MNNSSTTGVTSLTKAPSPSSKGHGRGDGGAGAGAAPATTVLTVEEAMRLYQRDGNATAALEAFVYPDEEHPSLASRQGIVTNTTTPTVETNPSMLWMWHNRKILEYITRSSKRSKHMQHNSSENNDDDNDDESLANSLSTMMLLQGAPADSSTPVATTTTTANSGINIARRYNCLVLMHNKCLQNYANGKYREAQLGALTSFIMGSTSIKVDSNGLVEITHLSDNIPSEKKNTAQTLGLLFLTTRLGFLLMDCHLALHSGDGSSVGRLSPITNADITIQMEDILLWIEKNSLFVTSKLGDSVRSGGYYEWFQHDELKFRLHLYRSRMLFAGGSSSCDDDDENELNDRLRVSRKELKNAMDIYQNKLTVVNEEAIVGREECNKRGKTSNHDCDSKGVSGSNLYGQQDQSETTSVTSMAGRSFVTSASDAIMSEAKFGGGIVRATFEGIPDKNPQSSDPSIGSSAMTGKVKNTNPNLHTQHESVLFLKANLEYLRGNTSKSLKLCAEARSAGKNLRLRDNDKDLERPRNINAPQDFPMSDFMESERHDTAIPSNPDGEARRKSAYGDAIYYNNLALLHQSAGKMFLALQYYSFALSYMQQSLDGVSPTPPTSRTSCWSNGGVCPDLTSEILSNKSLCAFHAQEFHTAYSCMAQCVKHSPSVFGKRARCWLRMAQSCIGKIGCPQLAPKSVYTAYLPWVYILSHAEGIHTKQQQTTTETESGDNADFPLSIELGSDEDLANISAHPLKRASICLYMALHLSAGNSNVDSQTITDTFPSPKEGCVVVDMDCYSLSIVSLVYIKMQLGDEGALEITGALGLDGTVANAGIALSPHLRSLVDAYHSSAAMNALKP